MLWLLQRELYPILRQPITMAFYVLYYRRDRRDATSEVAVSMRFGEGGSTVLTDQWALSRAALPNRAT